MQVFKGNIVTVNKHNDVVNYLVENKGMIEFVGNQLPDKYANWPTIDLKDKALIPAFVDTHQHFASFSTFNSGLNVRLSIILTKMNYQELENLLSFAEK